MQTKYQHLFSPGKIGKMEVKNRLHMSAMGGNDHILADGSFAKESAEYYIRRAKGGMGLISTGTITIRDCKGVKYLAEEQFLDENVDAVQFKMSCWDFMKQFHAYGAKIMMQISIGTTPSRIPGVFSPSMTVNDWTKEDIQYFIDRYADAAKVAKDAGFDMVEVHAVHTAYILDQFATAGANQRTDEYGGDVEGRAKIIVDILKAIKEKCGQDFPVSVKLGMTTDIYDYQEDGTVKMHHRTVEESIELARIFEREGYDAINSDGAKNNSIYCPRETNIEYFTRLKESVNIPVIIAGRFNDPDYSEKLLEEGACDFISIGRQTLCDPDYANKLKADKEEEVRYCLACNQACIGNILYGRPVSCALNPTASFAVDDELKPLKEKKKVMIVGGGLAGMEAARIADLRGHEVSLYEKKDYLGGVFVPASVFYFKEEDRKLIEWYRLQMRKSHVDIHMNTEVTKELIEQEKPDVVIVATGSKEFKLPVPGIDNPIVVPAIDALLNKKPIGDNVVIIGGGLTGCEISAELGYREKNVTVVEMLPEILSIPDRVLYNVYGLKALMKEGNVKVMESTALKEITDDGVIVENADGRIELKADTVITAVGYKKENALAEEIKMYAGEVYTIGDCDKVSNIMNAIWSGYALANGL